MNERLIFEHALDIPDPDQRNAYLEQVCEDDARLRQRVKALLASHAKDQSFLAGNAFTLEPTPDSTAKLEQLGDEIGPFKLLQQIGEGGMGVVYMAEQKTPVKRRVALKVIKPGMDTRQVIARFEAERQALALMDHPNIARVLDCGTTDSGRPYFVMELVKGIPITGYCDQNHLTPRQRLELFIPICQAIQHAHQKGIIHRDIKPSNILITEYDDRAVPKIIDFGVAKALSTRLTDKTMFTQLGQIVGTLEYMSPEQAKINQVDVDTRSDIYSLGVLLYELLTGETPFDRQRLRSAAFDEILKIIREEEPPRPSLRLSTSESLPSIASNRHVEPHKLTTLLRGELDWIVMKALEKDRGRRYDSASKFAEDVRHYLKDEEVSACPPSAWYRFRKFARRRRSALLTSATIAVVILLGVGLLGWNIRDRASRQEAAAREQSDRQTRLAAQVESVLFEANRLMEEKQWAAALSTAARAEAVVAGGDVDERTQEKVRELINDLQMVQRLEKARQLNAVWTATQFDHRGAAEELAAAFRQYGISLEKLPDQDSVARLKSRSRLVVRFAVALDDWAGYLNQMGRKSDAIKLMALADEIDSNSWRSQVRAALLHSGPKPERDGLLKKLAATAPVNDLAPSCFWQLASELRHRGYVEEGRDLLRKAQAAHPSDYWINFDLATFCNFDKTPEAAVEAAVYFRVANALRPIDAAPLNGLAGTLTTMGRLDESIACYQRALKVEADFTPAWVNLGRAYAAKNEFERALDNYERALNLAPQNARVHSNMGEALRNMGKLPEAIHAFETALKYDPRDGSTHNNLGIALQQMGQFEQAIEHFLLAIDINSNYAIAYVNLGNAQKACQLFDDAVSSYRKAIELHPKFQAAHYSLGIALMEAGRLDEAVVSWKEVLAIDPQSDRTACIQSYFNLGVSRAQRGDLDGAIQYWRTSLGIQPTDVRTRQYLVRAIVQQAQQLAGDNAVEQAQQACREALELTADRPDASLRQWRGEAEQLLKTMSDPESGTDDAINSNSQSPDSVQK